MNMDLALRATEILLGFAILQQSCEHLVGPARVRPLFLARILLCLGLIFGVQTMAMLLGLSGLGLVLLHVYQGPYNGGSDRMGPLILFCITGIHIAPAPFWRDAIFAYLAVQTVLSYFISGKVKLFNANWRNGQALQDVFSFSAYPVSEEMRNLSSKTQLLWVASWAVILFETAFPLALISKPTLIAALCIGAAFHLANACVFGLNRFFWTWLAAYPSLLWLQARLF